MPTRWRLRWLMAGTNRRPPLRLRCWRPWCRMSDDAPPTRAELEQKAAELGIKFDGRWGDKRLGEAIAAALKA